jgi:hypothetical protein
MGVKGVTLDGWKQLFEKSLFKVEPKRIADFFRIAGGALRDCSEPFARASGPRSDSAATGLGTARASSAFFHSQAAHALFVFE